MIIAKTTSISILPLERKYPGLKACCILVSESKWTFIGAAKIKKALGYVYTMLSF